MTDHEIKESEETLVSSEPPQEQAAPKPGAQLAKYREKAGISIEQIASRLKMSIRQVQLIEADNYDFMHSMAIARGFVRAYAKLLNVDSEPLIAMFPQEQQQIKPVAPPRSTLEPFAINRRPFKSRHGFSGKQIGWLIAALLIAGALIVWRGGWLSQNKSSSAKETASRQMPGKQNLPKETAPKEHLPASGSVSTEVVVPNTTVISDDAQPAAAKPEKAPASPADSASDTSVPSAAAAPAEKPESATVPTVQQPKGALVLRAREDTWVQILRSDSTVLYERILSPGQTETIAIKEPVSATIGNAPGLEATFRGKQLELRTAENSTVARLNLK